MKTDGSGKYRPAPIALVFFTLFLGVSSAFLFRNFTVDDAFITWREGENFSDGIFSWNSHGLKSDASTSPGYLLLSALAGLFDFDFVLFFKIAASLNIVILVITALRQDSVFKRVIFLSVATIAPISEVHIWSGLETGLYVTCMFFLIQRTWKEIQDGSRPGLQVTLLALSCTLLRFEGLIFVGLVLVARFIAELAHINPSSRSQFFSHSRWLLPSFAVFVVTCIFRFIQFGQLWPNSVSRKSLEQLPIGDFVLRALSNVQNFTWLLAALFVLVLAANLGKFLPTKRFALAVVVSFPVVLILLYGVSDLQMNYASRFAWQVLGPLFLFVVSTSQHLRIREALSTLLATALVMVAVPLGEIKELLNFYPSLVRSHGIIAEQFPTSAASSTVVLGDAGLIPFLAPEAEYLDYLFLTTPRLKTLEKMELLAGDRARQRELAVLVSSSKWPTRETVNRPAILKDLNLKGFELSGCYPWNSKYWNCVYANPAALKEIRKLDSTLVEEAAAYNLEARINIEDVVMRNWWSSDVLKLISR